MVGVVNAGVPISFVQLPMQPVKKGENGRRNNVSRFGKQNLP